MLVDLYVGNLLQVLPILDTVDLVFGSPPYEDARTYGIGFALTGQAWVDLMVRVYNACVPQCRGLTAFVVAGRTKRYQWSATPALLEADLHRAGHCLRNTPLFHRVGIPGSGGPDWLRSDYERIVCVTQKRGRLPWSDNKAMGHEPKYAIGGEPSHRIQSGERVNGLHKQCRQITHKSTKMTMRGYDADGIPMRGYYSPPTKANPGNVISIPVGGGKLGSKFAYENEAPFPEKLADFFIRSFCPPDGTVLDPFCGSGTTCAAAVKAGRRAIGIDIRESQVRLTQRRLKEDCGVTAGVYEI
jgi:hypothetical protein